ncbi:MAG: hypothetical protein ACPGU7_08305 [Gammaproteobacteria bacterium]
MKAPIVVIGIGEMGSVFARGFLRGGHPVYPVTRGEDMTALAHELPEPELALLAVAESDLHPGLEAIPEAWRSRLGLLQNELLPRDWEQHGISDPTVISVWFEKKKGQDSKVIIPSPAHGPKASLLVNCLGGIDIAARHVPDADAMLDELVIKNAYILTSNIAGLEVGGTVGDLWSCHPAVARAVFTDVMAIQDHLTGRENDRDAVLRGMLNAFDGDPDHKCMGRSAPARLARALEIADAAELAVPKLREIHPHG